MTNKHTSYFLRATMAPPSYFLPTKDAKLPRPSNPMRADLWYTQNHPTARDGSAPVMTPAIISAEFDLDGNVIRLESEHHIFERKSP